MLTMDRLRQNFNPGESFYSVDGEEWTDIYDEASEDVYTYEDENGDEVQDEVSYVFGNFCIKALTQKEDAVLFSDYNEALPLGTELSLSTPGGGAIYYSVNGGEEQLYTKPLVFTEDMTIEAYVSGSDAVFTQSYVQQEAQLSSLLYMGEYDNAYLNLHSVGDGSYAATYYYYGTLSETVQFLPISTGSIVCDGETQASGKAFTTTLSDENTVLLYVSGEGQKDTVYTISFVQYPDFIYGDVNYDDKVDAADAAEILVYAAMAGAGSQEATEDELWLAIADYNFDGSVDAADAAEILVYAAMAGAGL
jgi:hypothetical protein